MAGYGALELETGIFTTVRFGAIIRGVSCPSRRSKSRSSGANIIDEAQRVTSSLLYLLNLIRYSGTRWASA